MVTGLENVSFHSNPKKGNAKECSNYHTAALISHASKVMLKILFFFFFLGDTHTQNSPSEASTVHEPITPDVQAGFRKGRGTRDQIANIRWIMEKKRKFKHILLILCK